MPVGFARAPEVWIQKQNCRLAVRLLQWFRKLNAKDRLVTVSLEEKQGTFRLLGDYR